MSEVNKKKSVQKNKGKGKIQYYQPKKVKPNPVMDEENIEKLLNSDDENTNEFSSKINKMDRINKHIEENNGKNDQQDSDQDSESDEILNEQDEGQGNIIQSEQIEEDGLNDQQEENGAWVDENDKTIMVDISSVARLRKLRNHPDETTIKGDEYQRRLKKFYNEKLHSSSYYAWAFKDKEFQSDSELEDDNDDGEMKKQQLLDRILKQDYSILQEKNESESIGQQILDIEKYGIVRFQDKHNAVIQQVDFHQNSQIFLSAGLDKMVKIYNVRDQKQEYRDKIKLIKSIYLENLPIESARFISSRGEVLASGLKKHLLTIDLQKDSIEKVSSYLFTNRFEKKLGKFIMSRDEKYIALFNKEGFYVMILDAKTKQFLYEIKVTESLSSVDFSWDSQYVFALGMSGSIFQYCIQTRKIYDVVQDESVNPILIKCGKHQLATGSQSGIINLYQQNMMDNKVIPKPVKEFQNLTTEVSNIDFNYSNELMFFASKWKKTSLRMAHIPSNGVYQNWPNFKTNLSYVTASSFSFDNKFLALGNDKGQICLYNLSHYNNINPLSSVI